MSAALVLAGICLMILPGVGLLPFRRLHPAEWARAAAFALRAGHMTVRLGLFFGAAPTVLRATGVEHAAEMCHRMFGPVAPGGPLVGWASAAGFVALTVAAHRARAAQRTGHRSVLVEGWLGVHETVDGVDVVTVPASEAFAYAVPVGPGQIVLSQGLVDALDPFELEAVVAHEQSHLRHRHDRFLLAAEVARRAYGWMPPVAASAAMLQLGLERWADEDAAGGPGRREVVRDALAKTTATLLGPALAFSSTCTLVPRLHALDGAPPTPNRATRFAALGPLAVAGLLTFALLAVWSTYSHHGLLGIMGFCPD